MVDITETWNGTNWTEVNDMNVGRNQLGGAGTNTAALAFGGSEPDANTAKTENWNGTNWTEVGDLSTAIKPVGAGTNVAALSIGGESPRTAQTEEWNAGPTTSTLGSE